MENNEPVCWLETVDYQHADASLRSVYDSVKGPSGELDNLYQAFSLMPQTIKPADDLYRAALHHSENRLEKRFAELIGCYVAILSGCDYALTHHGHNFAQLHGDRQHAEQMLRQLQQSHLDDCGTASEVSALRYVEKLCQAPQNMSRADLADLSAHGWSGADILEIVQIVAMFSYFVRVINAVGISTNGEKIGFYAPQSNGNEG